MTYLPMITCDVISRDFSLDSENGSALAGPFSSWSEDVSLDIKLVRLRFKAHQIDQDYQLAIKDYQQVLVLEPRNTVAQTRLQLCHTLLRGQEPQLPPTDVSCKTVTAQNSGRDGQPDIAGRLSLTEDDDQTDLKMDTGQRLQQAEDTKQKGNELFQKNLYKEAECQYNQVLQHLPPATNLTGEVKEKRDKIAVAAHLNLALCQLRLGGNTTNIKEHCDEALKINPDSVKAYYRRAQAHKIDRNYQLAIKDYQQVLSLEPRNKAAQIWLQLCHTLRRGQKPQLPPTDVSCHTLAAQISVTDGQPDIAGRLSLTEDDVQTEYHDMEVGVECEADCFQRHSKCRKAAHHDKFIALADFTPKHLPPPYQDDKELYELILLKAKLTVWLMVMGISDERPKTYSNCQKPYPFSSVWYRGVPRVGSGWVYGVRLYTQEDKEDCPCETCQKSGTPAKQWGKIFIETAAHVVCDIKEGENTKCRFFYDSDKISLNECPTVQAAQHINSAVEIDYCQLAFISHDMDLVKQLNQLSINHRLQALQIKRKYTHFSVNEPKTGDEMLQELSSLQARLERSIQLWGHVIEKMRATVDNATPQWLYEYVTWLENNGYPDRDFLTCLIRAKLRGDRVDEIVLEDMSGFLDQLCEVVKEITKSREVLSKLPAVFDIHQKLREFLLKDHSFFCGVEKDINKTVKLYVENVFDKREAITINVPTPMKHTYDPAYPLTVIDSHPHGLSKKISIGEVVEREEFSMDELLGVKVRPDKDQIRYRYNNVTCPGSSGARVFILGKCAVCSYPGHGGSKRLTPNGQINETVLNQEFFA